MTDPMPGRATTAAIGSMTRRQLLAGASRLGLLATLVSLGALAGCKKPPDEPWSDGTFWSDGTGWRP
jgi:hypothetical protein